GLEAARLQRIDEKAAAPAVGDVDEDIARATDEGDAAEGDAALVRVEGEALQEQVDGCHSSLLEPEEDLGPFFLQSRDDIEIEFAPAAVEDVLELFADLLPQVEGHADLGGEGESEAGVLE